MKKYYLFILLVMLPLLVFIYYPNGVSALSGRDFNASNIIDDSIFFNGNGLSSNQAQTFLNAKMPNCDTWHSRSANQLDSGPPYTCLKDYSQNTWNIPGDAYCRGFTGGNKSAAQIIYEVGISCGVSQKVIFVTLQKEQSFITDSWPWEAQYTKATGYGCPDTALPISVDSNRNGCYDEFEGFFKQVYYGARQFKRYAKDANIFTDYRPYRTSWVKYNPNGGCGGTNLYIQNQATSGLYIYTPYQPNQAALNNLYGTGDGCSAYGNRNFWRLFNDWFGSTKLAPGECDSKVKDVSCVWSLVKGDGSQFLTASAAERDLGMNTFGWVYEGIAFYASPRQLTSTVPTYRLRQNNQHLYTTDQSEYTNLRNSGSWIDEGVAFYVYPSSTTTNISHRTYRLYSPSLNSRQWTMDENRKNALISSGYTLEAHVFNSLSGAADLPIPQAGRLNIYRLQHPNNYFYTSNLYELEIMIRSSYSYEGVLTTENDSSSGTPVFRLQYNGKYFYTTSINEKNLAIQRYSMSYEGVGFYLDTQSSQIYRLSNILNNRYLYTSSGKEVLSISNTGGWTYEGLIFSNNTDISPVYRFINLFNGRHFYTIDINEAAIIANKSWRYETIAFSSSISSGLPVYRLLLGDKHFYTTNPAERDIAVRQFGYLNEGVVFFASNTATDSPVYRLQGGNDEYFYTSSSEERDRAISTFGYKYENIGFYLPLN